MGLEAWLNTRFAVCLLDEKKWNVYFYKQSVMTAMMIMYACPLTLAPSCYEKQNK